MWFARQFSLLEDYQIKQMQTGRDFILNILLPWIKMSNNENEAVFYIFFSVGKMVSIWTRLSKLFFFLKERKWLKFGHIEVNELLLSQLRYIPWFLRHNWKGEISPLFSIHMPLSLSRLFLFHYDVLIVIVFIKSSNQKQDKSSVIQKKFLEKTQNQVELYKCTLTWI